MASLLGGSPPSLIRYGVVEASWGCGSRRCWSGVIALLLPQESPTRGISRSGGIILETGRGDFRRQC